MPVRKSKPRKEDGCLNTEQRAKTSEGNMASRLTENFPVYGRKEYQFAKVAIAEYHGLGGFNNRNVFSYNLEDEAQEQCEAGLASPAVSPWLADGHALAASSQGRPGVPGDPSVSPHLLLLQGDQSDWIWTYSNGKNKLINKKLNYNLCLDFV